LAHNNKLEFLDAAREFLNALILNPKAEHIWNYVRQAVLQADRIDLLEKL
jgi:peroxin-5